MFEAVFHLLSVVAFLAAWPAMLIAVLLAHEAAHALSSMLVGFPVRVVRIGSGPCLRAWWIGAARLEWRLHPWSGHVEFVPRGTRFLKLRHVVVSLSGPTSTVALGVLCWHLRDSEFLRTSAVLGSSGLTLLAWTLWAIGAISFLPIGDAHRPSDVQSAWRVLRTSSAALAAASSYWQAMEQDREIERHYLRGDADTSERLTRARMESNPDDFDRLPWLSILRASAGDFDGAIAIHTSYEAKLEDWLANRSAPDAHMRAQHRHLRTLASVNRAFHLVLRGTSEDVAEARRLSESWGPDQQPWSEAKVAIQRTRGFVLLHTEERSRAANCLRRAIAGEEPYWLRALGMSCLALGRALQKDPIAAQRMLRRARRLHPQSLLVPHIEAKVARALAAS